VTQGFRYQAIQDAILKLLRQRPAQTLTRNTISDELGIDAKEKTEFNIAMTELATAGRVMTFHRGTVVEYGCARSTPGLESVRSAHDLDALRPPAEKNGDWKLKLSELDGQILGVLSERKGTDLSRRQIEDALKTSPLHAYISARLKVMVRNGDIIMVGQRRGSAYHLRFPTPTKAEVQSKVITSDIVDQEIRTAIAHLETIRDGADAAIKSLQRSLSQTLT